MEFHLHPARPQADELVSCLCVTEDRRAFLPWLLWNYRKQDFVARELVIVDSSSEAPPGSLEREASVVRCPPGTSVAQKRNLAVEAARGSILTWFDDDDWQHPRKLSILVKALGRGAALAGPLRSWFVDLGSGRARPHRASRSLVFNGLAVRRNALAGVHFDSRRARAADTAWVTSVRRQTRRAPVAIDRVVSFWLCHSGNISNPASRYVFPYPIDAVRDDVGPSAWGETCGQLTALRRRVGGVWSADACMSDSRVG